MAAALPTTLVGANAGLGDARGLEALRTRAAKDPNTCTVLAELCTEAGVQPGP